MSVFRVQKTEQIGHITAYSKQEMSSVRKTEDIFMRSGKIIPAALISAMLLSGCGGSGGGILEKAPDISVPFGSAVKIQAGELEFEGSVKRYAAGIWQMDITAPDTISGLCIRYDDGSGISAKLDDIAFEVPSESVRDNAVFALIFKAIDCAAASGELPCTDTEDGKVYSGEFSGGTYTLTFDPRTAALTHIEIPYGEISGEFTDFSVIKDEELPQEETSAASG